MNCRDTVAARSAQKFPVGTLLASMLTQKAVSNRELLCGHEWNFERIEMLGSHRQANQSAAYCAMKLMTCG